LCAHFYNKYRKLFWVKFFLSHYTVKCFHRFFDCY
jgi:hypothetical protein